MKKSLFLLPLLGILSLSSCTIVNILPGEPLPEIIEGTTFTGEIELDKNLYNLSLELDSDSNLFLLTVDSLNSEQKIPNKKGYYTFQDGIGYELTFFNNIKLKSTYNNLTKCHELNYELSLNNGLSGICILTHYDPTFTDILLTRKQSYIHNAVFKRYFNVPQDNGKPNLTILQKINFLLDQTFKITSMYGDEKTFLPEYDLEGTYIFENNTFNLTIGDKAYTSTFNLSTREYTIPYDDGIAFKYNPTIGEETLSGWVDFKGGVYLDLYMFADGTMFGDATTGMKSMNEAFDGRGTWTQNEDGSRTLNYKVFGQDKVAQVVADPENEGKFKCDYVLIGSEADALVIPLSGTFNKVFNLSGAGSHGDINLDFTVEFNSANIATLTISGGDQGPKLEEIAYTFENNIITITQTGKEISYASKYDEETGTYKLPFTYISTIPGVGDFDFVTELTYTLW